MNAEQIGQAREGLSIIKDPFNKESMNGLTIICAPQWTGDAWYYNGFVKFKNGSTKGEQKFEAENLHSLLLKMETFIGELE